MSDDPILDLLDDLLAIADGTEASVIEVSADGFSVRVRRVATTSSRPRVASDTARQVATAVEFLQVRSPAVGIFSTAQEWRVGDRVAPGTLLGDVQSLGHVAEINAPVEGAIREVLTPNGAPVEYGQPLFALDRA